MQQKEQNVMQDDIKICNLQMSIQNPPAFKKPVKTTIPARLKLFKG